MSISESATPPAAGPIPGPKGSLIWGVMRDFSADIPTFIAQVARDHGDVTSFRLGPMRVYMLTHPDDIETVLVKDHKRYRKDRVTLSLDELLGQGLVTSSGEYWRRQRKLAAPLLQRRQIATYADEMVARTQHALASWKDGEERDLQREMMHLTLDVVLRTLFDASDAGAADLARIGEGVETVMVQFQTMLDTWRRFAPRWLPHKPRRLMRAAVAELDQLVHQLIASTRERGAKGTDLLSRLMSARYEDGSAMSDQQLRDEAITMMVAGHETTAMALSWTLHLLADAPEVVAQLEAEVDAVLEGRDATFEDVAKLTFTDAVIKESMRLYPPVWSIGRAPLEPVTFRGYTLPKEAEIFISQWVVHRDPRWYDDPETFTPSRWLDGLAKQLPRFAYFPFGGGPRVCIGNHFAMMEATLILATLAQSYRFERASDAPMETLPSVTLRMKNGLKMRLKAR